MRGKENHFFFLEKYIFLLRTSVFFPLVCLLLVIANHISHIFFDSTSGVRKKNQSRVQTVKTSTHKKGKQQKTKRRVFFSLLLFFSQRSNFLHKEEREKNCVGIGKKKSKGIVKQKRKESRSVSRVYIAFKTCIYQSLMFLFVCNFILKRKKEKKRRQYTLGELKGK